ncbi:protein of unknown function [Flavobacterium micromati]|jgi:hypothetical protein|uniref:DUF4296 domain-containing protein n=1 Tax=Flavobacterium micromati TaxID=229205 RepID=A0A1M5NI49_9FLAO|nr:DUF4296 domain-containing protein [Flavobacterium micromati]SHG88623.1 protein of unknown function [Flavobacterium micromati]
MNKYLIFIAVFTLIISCKEEKKPARLIEKDVMVKIIYDLSVLQAIKYQNPTSIDSFKINARDFVYKKYKVDSLQFAQSNIYYSSNGEQYKEMFSQVVGRINAEKTSADSLIKAEIKKQSKGDKKKGKELITAKDSLKKAGKKVFEKDAVKKVSLEKEALQ